MRTVLLGSDLMYNQSGNLKLIETNTAVGWDGNKIENDEDCLNLENLNQLILENNFSKIIYIGGIYYLNKELEKFCASSNILYEYVRVDQNSLTIPDIRDSENILIIRSGYDVTAIVDEEYCKDKIGLQKLISNNEYGNQFAYKDENGNLINTITTILNNGEHPNFILKCRYPSYDRTIYPKLYKVTNQTELDVVLQNVDDIYFLMPFYFNAEKLYENHIKVFRGLNLLYPPNLQSVSIGGYTKITPLKINWGNNIYDSFTYELVESLRAKYITGPAGINAPKLEDTDQVQMADGSWKTALQLQIGDLIKTINFPNTENVDIKDELANLNITYEELQSGSTYSSNIVQNKRRVDKINDIVKINFTDGTNWEDVEASSYLTIKEEIVRFVFLSALNVGDSIILVDTADDTKVAYVAKEIASITKERSIFSGWEIVVEREHIFLTKSTEGDTTSYAAIEHNTSCGCSPCSPCPKDCSGSGAIQCNGGFCANC